VLQYFYFHFTYAPFAAVEVFKALLGPRAAAYGASLLFLLLRRVPFTLP
jgi:hypothetical protein